MFLGNWNPFSRVGFASKLFRNPMTTFVFGILSKWYLIGMVAAITTTYWVFKGLKDIGVIDKAETILTEVLDDTQSIARFCTPKITNIYRFWDCLQNPPKAQKTKEEQDLYNSLMNVGKDIIGDLSGERQEQQKKKLQYYNVIKNNNSKKLQDYFLYNEDDVDPYSFYEEDRKKSDSDDSRDSFSDESDTSHSNSGLSSSDSESSRKKKK